MSQQFVEDVAAWVWRSSEYDSDKHSLAKETASLEWSHTDGYSYSEYTWEDTSDEVVVTVWCVPCGTKHRLHHEFTGSDLANFLQSVSLT